MSVAGEPARVRTGRRGSVRGLPSAHPLADLLPGVYLEDAMVRGLAAGLDPLLAPVFLTLDCLDAYLDPGTAPADFLPWLASWLGETLDEKLPTPRRRALVDEVGELQPLQGTRRALVRYLEIVTGGSVEVRESGGAAWSAVPGAEPPGSATPGLTIIVRVADPGRLDAERLREIVHDMRPAHLPYDVVVERAG